MRPSLKRKALKQDQCRKKLLLASPCHICLPLSHFTHLDFLVKVGLKKKNCHISVTNQKKKSLLFSFLYQYSTLIAFICILTLSVPSDNALAQLNCDL